MKIRGGYILYLLILCAVVGCKGTSSPSPHPKRISMLGHVRGKSESYFVGGL